MATVAVPVAEGSSPETAVIVTDSEALLVGAVYNPFAVMKPSVTLPPANPALHFPGHGSIAGPHHGRGELIVITRCDGCAEGLTVTRTPESIFSVVSPNVFKFTVLVATIKNPLVGGSVAGAV